MDPDIIEIIAPDGTILEFPASMSDDEIARVMREEYGGPEDAAVYDMPGMSEATAIDLREPGFDPRSLTKDMWVIGEKGVPYQLPSDPIIGEGEQSGDVTLRPGVLERPQEKQDTLGDVARSFVSGAQQGITGVAGLPGSVKEMLGQGPGFGTPWSPLSTRQLDILAQAYLGPYHDPQTTAGEYSRTIGEFLPGAIVPGGAAIKAASVLVPAVASETAGQLTEGTPLETPARITAGVLGGLGVGGWQALRSGGDEVLRRAAQGVSPEALARAEALRTRSPVPLTAAEAIQQVTGGSTNLGRVQRVVEQTTNDLGPMMAQRPEAVRQAVGNVAAQIAPEAAPQQVAGQAQQAAEGVITRMRQRVNENAQPFYERLPGQSLPPEQYAQLAENPSYARALEAVRSDPEIAPLLQAELPMDQATRMLRARQQGFTTQGYRGAAGDAPIFSTSREAQKVGTFFTSDPQIAATYAPRQGGAIFPVLAREGRSVTVEGGGNNWARLPQDTPVSAPPITVSRAADNDLLEALGQPRGPETTVRPAIQTTAGEISGSIGDYVSTDALAQWAKQQGYGGLRTNNIVDSANTSIAAAPSTVSTVFSADDLRSAFDRFAAPTPDNDLNVINRVVQQLDQMQDAATPGQFNPLGNQTIATQRSRAADLARALASEASPDFAMARQTVATGREAFVDPLKRGPLGTIAGQRELRPALNQQLDALFPQRINEGQAGETVQALRLMGEIDPTAPAPLVRQYLATQANQSLRDIQGGANQFGGASLAARLAGTPEAERALIGSVEAVAPMASRDVRDLVEALRATGQRMRPGSDTAFNQEIIRDLGGGGVGGEAVRAITTPTSIPGRINTAVTDFLAERNARNLAQVLMAQPEESTRAIRKALRSRRGGNRVRTSVAISQNGEE